MTETGNDESDKVELCQIFVFLVIQLVRHLPNKDWSYYSGQLVPDFQHL